MLTTTQHSQPPAAASQHALPDPGEQVPTLSWPIVGIFTFALALFGASTWAALTDTFACDRHHRRERRSNLRPVHRVARRLALLDQLTSLGQRRLRSRGNVLRLASDLIQVVRVHPY